MNATSSSSRCVPTISGRREQPTSLRCNSHRFNSNISPDARTQDHIFRPMKSQGQTVICDQNANLQSLQTQKPTAIRNLSSLATLLTVAGCSISCSAAQAADPAQLGPVEVGWQIYVGAAAGVIPFGIGAYEFGKRILIQRRCTVCSGSGLVLKGRFLRKCPECGGFFPWQGWRQFFTSTASPGNGGVLCFPKEQSSVFYKVPELGKDMRGSGKDTESSDSQ